MYIAAVWDRAVYRTPQLAKGLGSSSWLTAGAAFSYTAKGAYYDTDRPMRLLVRDIDGYFVLFNLINAYSYSIDVYTIYLIAKAEEWRKRLGGGFINCGLERYGPPPHPQRAPSMELFDSKKQGAAYQHTN